MSLSGAQSQLSTSLDELWSGVCELVVTVHEDRPAGSDLAVVDDLAERVSELQAAVHEAREQVRLATPDALPRVLSDVDASVDRARTQYWRDLRAHAAVSHLRTAARTRGGQWQLWRRSVEQAAARCEDPLDRVGAAVRSGWHEVGELVVLGVGRPTVARSGAPPPRPPSSSSSIHRESTRRSS